MIIAFLSFQLHFHLLDKMLLPKISVLLQHLSGVLGTISLFILMSKLQKAEKFLV